MSLICRMPFSMECSGANFHPAVGACPVMETRTLPSELRSASTLLTLIICNSPASRGMAVELACGTVVCAGRPLPVVGALAGGLVAEYSGVPGRGRGTDGVAVRGASVFELRGVVVRGTLVFGFRTVACGVS